MTRFRVKVCGITRPQDGALAARLGVDLIGLIFHPSSPRVVTVRQGERILSKIPPVVQTVGVFVTHPTPEIIRIATYLRLDYVQLHGDQTVKDVPVLQLAGFKVIHAYDGSVARLPKSPADIIMLDNLAGGHRGGSGKTFSWPTRPRRAISNLMLAGGLNEKNLEEGVRLFRPLIVDVNSGVESAPGVKSRVKLTRFMHLCDRLRYGN